MKASCVIPVYNQKTEDLAKTFEAIKKQNLQLKDIIIIDDGSSNHKLIEKLCQLFKFRYYYQKNQGPAIARNGGIKESKEEIIIFLDADCIPFPGFFANILKPFKNQSISGVQGEYTTKNFNSYIARFVGYEISYRHRTLKKNRFIDHIATYACAYRKKDLGAGFSTKFRRPDMEDIELSYRLSTQGKKLIFCPNAIVKHPHPESLFKYLKQQFKRGYWRVLGHQDYPKKLFKNSYFGYTLLIQGWLSSVFLLSLPFTYIYSYVPISFFGLLYISNIRLGWYCFNKQLNIISSNKFKFYSTYLFIIPFIASLRSIAGTLGFGIGLISKLIKDLQND